MKRLKKRGLSCLLAVLLLVGMMPAAAADDGDILSGTCGMALTWELNTVTGDMTIRGSGEMTEFEEMLAVPWDNVRDKIRTLTIEDGVTSIGECAFLSCGYLSRVTIPESVTSIADDAFNHCPCVTEYCVAADNPSYCCDAYGVLFDKQKTTLYQYPAGNARTDYTVPDSITCIFAYAFESCDHLVAITIPESVARIEDYAFAYCNNLPSITIPNGVTSIGDYAFSWCSELSDISIADSVTRTGNRAFEYTAYAQDQNNWSDGVLYIGHHLIEAQFSYSGACAIRDETVSIADNAFHMRNGLTSVTIPGSVTYIGQFSFAGCTNLASVTIGDGVKRIGEHAFSSCSRLAELVIPDSVTQIDDAAVFKCSALRSVVIGNGVTDIGSSAFSGCKALSSLTVGAGVQHIETGAFSSCSSLPCVHLPDSLESIGIGAFRGCTALADITIGDNVKQIEGVAFSQTAYESNDANWTGDVLYLGRYLLRARETITGTYEIPDGTLYIADGAFNGCRNLTGVTIPDGIPQIGWETFYGCTALESVILPDSVTSIGQTAFCQCLNLTYIHIPSTVTSIGWSCFTWHSPFYICSDSTECLAKTYADENWIEFCVCSGHTVPHTHTYTAVVTEPTCTADGFTTYTCSRCGDSYVNAFTDALGHDFGEWIVTVEPTADAQGEERRECSRCDAFETREIPKLPDDDSPTFALTGGTAHAGETIEVSVLVRNNPGIVSAVLRLSYDPQVLTLLRVRNGDVFPEDVFHAGSDLTQIPYGTAWLDALGDDNTQDGTLVTFTFAVAAEAPAGATTVTLTYDTASTFNAQLTPMEFAVQNAEWQVIERIAGDTNGDGSLDLKDAVTLIRGIVGGWGVTVVDVNADVNADGSVDLRDATLIVRYLAGWDVTLI